MKNKILNLFAYEHSLSFSQIRSMTKIRSNNLSYWLNLLLKEDILKKNDKLYSLSESSEHLIPYLSSNNSTLSVVLIKIGNKSNFLLNKRLKRPYKNLLGLPGGRLMIGESPKDAATRIMKNKYDVEISKPRITNVFLEHVKKKTKPIYSFLIILLEANAKNDLKLTNIVKNRKKIIPSDYYMMKSTPKHQDISIIHSNYI